MGQPEAEHEDPAPRQTLAFGAKGIESVPRYALVIGKPDGNEGSLVLKRDVGRALHLQKVGLLPEE
jgi:hypothetical protein